MSQNLTYHELLVLIKRLIKRLQSAELVEKVRTDEDERVVRLFLTDKAKQLEPLIAEVQTKVACKTDLSSSEFFELLSTLNELTNSLNKREEAAEKVL